MPGLTELTKLYRLDMEKPHPGGVAFEGRLFLYALVQLYQPKHVIEIGVSAGRSSCWLAAAMKDCKSGGRLTSVDNWSQHSGGKANSPERARARLEQAGVADVVDLVSANSHEWLPEQADDSAEIVWVDGDHSYKGAVADLCQALRVASQLVVVHDTVILPQVRQACELAGGGMYIDRERGFWLHEATRKDG